ADLHARRPVLTPEAEVAFDGQIDFALHRRALERYEQDVAPRAAIETVVARDAGRGIDRDLARAERPRNRARWTPDQARGIAALITRGRHHPVPVAIAFADEHRRPFVRIGAGAHAIVAARARIEIDEHHALAVDQAGVHGH